MSKSIKSEQLFEPLPNQLYKLAKSLNHKKHRDETGLFFVEGNKIYEELLKSDYHIEFILTKTNSHNKTQIITDKFRHKGVRIFEVDDDKFNSISDTVTPQDILAVIRKRDDKFFDNKPVIILDEIQDPGNLGTIIRTADWFGFNQILLVNNCADKYNPKTIRATMGSFFHSSILTIDNFEKFIQEKLSDYELFGSVLDGKISLDKIKPISKFGIVFGNESHGISESIEIKLSKTYKIEGTNSIDSLNVGVAVGISLHYFGKYISK